MDGTLHLGGVAILDNSNTFQSGEIKMNYNVKTIEYVDSIQIRTYKRPVTVKNKIRTQKPKQTNSARTHAQVQHSIQSSVSRTVNQIYSIARANRWDYFITLTIDPKKLDNTDFNLVSEKLNIWTNNLKKRYAPDLKYILVPELHKDKTKWHFHGLFADIGQMPLAFSGKTCIGKFVYDYAKKPYATKIFNLPLWKYGFSTATKINDSSKASSYITKYITKDISHILQNQHRYLASQNTDRPIEKVYNVDYDELARIYSKYLSDVSYITDVKVPMANQEILYMEFNKTVKPSETIINYKLFEPKQEQKEKIDFEKKKQESKKRLQEDAERIKKTVYFSNKKLSAAEHLQQLRVLKKMLIENPELKKLYSDINIDFQILRTKKQMYDEMEKNKHEQIGLPADGFIPVSESPFS